MKSSCFVMGLGSLCVRCVQRLLDDGGFEVKGVISADEAVIDFGKQRGIETLHIKNKVRYAASKREIDEFLTRSSFDYFFSIINAMFLPEEIVRLPRKLAVNFHDSELPKYAGIDATSWAIMREDPRYAVTWHVMVRGIDEGDIVKQVHVPVDARETAYSLNEKCLDAGFAAFGELLGDLSKGTVTYRPQPPELRSYYSRSKPELPEMSIWNYGVVSWRRRASEIEALTRALDYGPTRNSLGTAKIFIDGDFYILPSVVVREHESALPPGTVVDNDGAALVIATSSNDVAVNEVLTIYGQPISIAALSARHRLVRGELMGEAPPELIQAIKALDKEIMWKEAFWVKAIQGYGQVLSGAVLSPEGDDSAAGTAGQASRVATAHLSERTHEAMRRLIVDHDLDEAALLFSSFASFLAEVLNVSEVPIWYSDEEYRQGVVGMTKVFSPFVLCRVTFDGPSSILEHHHQLRQRLRELKQQKYFPYDIFYRHPQLRSGRGLEPLQQFAFVARAEGGPGGDWAAGGGALVASLEVIGSVRQGGLVVRCAGATPASARWLAEQLAAYLDARMAGAASQPA